jgi:hypothetical protein
MTYVELPDSVAIFGSVARGDGDRMSDKDILVISDHTVARRRFAARARKDGWSPVCFTWRRLDRAAAGTGLFIQHLKLEASILRDCNGRLRESLDRFSPRSEYDREVAGSHELLGVLEKMPNCLSGRYWALDVLAVGLRTLSVATLANHGIYEFSFGRILNSLHRVGVLKSGDIERLHAIREYKWRHRNANIRPSLSLSHTLGLVDLISQRFKLGLHVQTIKPEEALGFAALGQKLSPNWYLRSRVLERALMSLQLRSSAEPEVLHSKRRLQELIREPSQYGWRVKSDWPSLLGQVDRISAYSDIRFSTS